MDQNSLFAGHAIRRLRRREGLTQIALAARLAISPSYLNLIERNQRPLSARVLIKLAEHFDFDARSLSSDDTTGGIDGLRRRLADSRFADLAVDRDEIAEWLAAAPRGAIAFARLYDAADHSAITGTAPDALNLVRREIERWKNHFADLDAAAEQAADEMRLSNPDVGAALVERLRVRHKFAVRILPADIMSDALRRLDLHARQLQLSEMLDQASRNFHIASQIAVLEQSEMIGALADGANFPDRAAWRLFRRHLTGYFAAALLMPYERFMRACESTGYDFTILQRRFGVGFEQLAHRLTTLQRVGQRGLPFFMARIDRAGQFSKRYAGASGSPLLDNTASCPLWVAHQAFERPGQICMQTAKFMDTTGVESRWFTMARTVEGPGASQFGQARFVVVVGVEAALATSVTAAAVMADSSPEVDIGPGCVRCFRPACAQRSLPPHGATLQFDERSRGITPFEFMR